MGGSGGKDGGSNAPGSSTWRAANDHQKYQDMHSDRSDGSRVHGIETGGARGDGMKKGGEQLSRVGLARMQAELADPNSNRPEDDEAGGDCENEASVDSQAGPSLGGIPQSLIEMAQEVEAVAHDNGTNAAEDDEKADGDVEGGIVTNPRVGQAVGEGGKARVAESGDRVKDGLESALTETTVSRQGGEKKESPNDFGDKGEDNDEADDVGDLGEVFFRDHFPQDLMIVKRHPAEENGGEVKSEGHDAQAADLNQAEDDDLSRGGEKGGGVFDGETRDADGAGAGKEGIQPGQCEAGFDGAGKFEEQGANSDDEGEAAHEKPAGAHVQVGDLGLMAQGTEPEGKENAALNAAVEKNGELLTALLEPGTG